MKERKAKIQQRSNNETTTSWRKPKLRNAVLKVSESLVESEWHPQMQGGCPGVNCDAVGRVHEKSLKTCRSEGLKRPLQSKASHHSIFIGQTSRGTTFCLVTNLSRTRGAICPPEHGESSVTKWRNPWTSKGEKTSEKTFWELLAIRKAFWIECNSPWNWR